jgi:hypothetical protein
MQSKLTGSSAVVVLRWLTISGHRDNTVVHWASRVLNLSNLWRDEEVERKLETPRVLMGLEGA